MHLEPLYSFTATLTPRPIGPTPDGLRVNVEFEGELHPGGRLVGQRGRQGVVVRREDRERRCRHAVLEEPRQPDSQDVVPDDPEGDAGVQVRTVDHVEIKEQGWDLNIARYIKGAAVESISVEEALARRREVGTG